MTLPHGRPKLPATAPVAAAGGMAIALAMWLSFQSTCNTGRAAPMWKQYRKTFIPIQALILTVCAILYWGLRVEAHSVVTIFVVMEAG
jgi:hypothetical protein